MVTDERLVTVSYVGCVSRNLVGCRQSIGERIVLVKHRVSRKIRSEIVESLSFLVNEFDVPVCQRKSESEADELVPVFLASSFHVQQQQQQQQK